MIAPAPAPGPLTQPRNKAIASFLGLFHIPKLLGRFPDDLDKVLLVLRQFIPGSHQNSAGPADFCNKAF
jgi:hypothetical protein